MKLEDEIEQKEFKNIFQKTGINIIFTNNWLGGKNNLFFKKYDITSQQFNVLRILRGQFPNPCSINIIKQRMLDRVCDASRIVERLKIKGLVERSRNEFDRRAVDIKISDKGLTLLEEIDSEEDQLSLSIKKNLSSEEAETLNQLLDKIRN